jgi:cytochrome c peroxidase
MNADEATFRDARTENETRHRYYKVPSLKGVWYRGPFEHNGSVATFEDSLDAIASAVAQVV